MCRPSDSLASVSVINNTYINGHLQCQFSFETDAEDFQGEPNPILKDANYFILYAAGYLGQTSKFTLLLVYIAK